MAFRLIIITEKIEVIILQSHLSAGKHLFIVLGDV